MREADRAGQDTAKEKGRTRPGRVPTRDPADVRAVGQECLGPCILRVSLSVCSTLRSRLSARGEGRGSA